MTFDVITQPEPPPCHTLHKVSLDLHYELKVCVCVRVVMPSQGQIKDIAVQKGSSDRLACESK